MALEILFSNIILEESSMVSTEQADLAVAMLSILLMASGDLVLDHSTVINRGTKGKLCLTLIVAYKMFYF